MSTDHQPKVLVLLATYNGVKWIEEQLETILAQNNVRVDLLIGDDVSTDGTREMLGARAVAPNVQICGWDEASGSAGNNFRRLFARAELSGYDYVALADQDDVWHPNKLERGIAALRASGAQGYSCAVEAFWPDGRAAVLAQDPHMRAADFLFEGAGQGCTFVIRAETFARVQQFSRDHPAETGALHYHDWLIYLLARAWRLAWYFDSRSMIRYRQHGGNEIGSRGGAGAIGRRLAMIRNGWYLGQVRAASQVYRKAGGSDPLALALGSACLPGRSLVQRCALLLQVAQHGRRRLADRVVLVLAVAVGWL